MRKYLLPKEGNFYKANLHCHTDISDGKLSPEEVKKIYKEKGYSVVAYTDHDVLIPHPELSDEDFLALYGYEIEIEDKKPFYKKFRFVKSCHICLIALNPDDIKQVCYHREKYFIKNAVNYRDRVKFDENLPDFERVYSPECINEIIRRGREAGFFVTYNHPAWNLENYSDYMRYYNMHAMEICNYGAFESGYLDYNEKEYEDMLRGGKKIYCIATDDNHNYRNDSFGGFTMIKADKLEYKTITDSLLAGNFYASQGPEIHSLWYEDGKIHIDCSDVKRILFYTADRRIADITASEGEFVNTAEFDVIPDEDVYVRITVVDAEGKHANTNAYFVDDLIKE